jgi:hypothetical protein
MNNNKHTGHNTPSRGARSPAFHRVAVRTAASLQRAAVHLYSKQLLL